MKPLSDRREREGGGHPVGAAWNSVVIGFPVLLLQLAVTTGIFLAGLIIYFSLTPYRELKLLREGNVAAATVLAGEMLALAVPLAAMMAHSANVPDIVLWGVVTIVLQLIAAAAVAVLLRQLPAAIERGEVASALVVAAAQLSAGILNAAAMSG
jgi:putative membrane protein